MLPFWKRKSWVNMLFLLVYVTYRTLVQHGKEVFRRKWYILGQSLYRLSFWVREEGDCKVIHRSFSWWSQWYIIYYQISWNVKCHEMSNVIKCQMSWTVKCNKMSNVMTCQISWNADAGYMTPSRNTLRSVPSSPGRSFCKHRLPHTNTWQRTAARWRFIK